MDEIVRAALQKWPNVPHCYSWLALDARGVWRMRDERSQALNLPGDKIRNATLIGFINRNYQHDDQGRWYFQNGPQRVYVELEATPLIWRVNAEPGFAVTAHTGQPARVQRSLLDEHGRLYLETDVGFGLVHTLDMLHAADAVEQGLWVPQEVVARELPTRFGYVRSPEHLQKMLEKK